jgi:hypothetical protein
MVQYCGTCSQLQFKWYGLATFFIFGRGTRCPVRILPATLTSSMGQWEDTVVCVYVRSVPCPCENLLWESGCTANERPVRIQYKCLVPIYVFLEIKLLFPKQKYNVLSPSSCTEISVRDLYISRIGLPILLQEICGLSWEYINRS